MIAAPEITRLAERQGPSSRKRRPSAAHSLPPELQADAARRLGWLALVYAVGVAFGHFGHRLLLVASGSLELTFRASDILGFTAITMGLAVALLSRSGLVSVRRLIDIGLVFEVLGTIGI